VLRRARGENLAALASARCDDRPTALGRHANAEAVRLGALPVVRLVCTLHVDILRSGAPETDPDAEPSDYTDRPLRVSNLRFSATPTLVAGFRIPWRGFHSPLAKLIRKLWIVWKTHDLRLPSLWITSLRALLEQGPSVRIGAVL
jgi:hypothetical protein